MVQDNPLDVENIKEKQDEDNHLQQSVMRHPEWYSRKTFNDIADVLCYTKPGDDPSNWKVALPRELIGPTVNWYNQVTGHPGSKRLYEQVRQLQENMHNVGYHVIRGHKYVYMILGQNSQDQNFRYYERTATSCTSAKYLQSNAVCERMHQTVGNVLRTLLHGRPPQNITSAKEFVDEALSIASHAMRAEVHVTLGSSPGSLVFNRDMFLNTPSIADWHTITQKQKHLIYENLLCENQKRRRYIPQKRVLKKRWKPRKLDERTSGLYRVVETHVNGTETIELRPGVSERLNIQRNIPYK